MSRPIRIRPLAALVALSLAPGLASAAGFVYEGRLDDGGAPANGRYDLQLSPYADAKSGAALGAAIVFEDVPVVDGRFRVDFDLPLSMATSAWIQVGVRDGAAVGAFSAIPGRSEAASAKAIGACWSSTGDSATNPALNFLGTTDAQPLVLRVQNQQVVRYEPSALSFNGAPITANLIAGAPGNTVFADVRGAVIGGGGAIAGGDPDVTDAAPNRVNDHFGTVGGGASNLAGDQLIGATSAAVATVGGGLSNTASAYAATVGGGALNVAAGVNSVVAGGINNRAVNSNAAVGGGQTNSAIGRASVVPGGQFNCAGGADSFAGGTGARVRRGTESTGPLVGSCASLPFTTDTDGDQGTFVWSSRTADFTSSGPEQFLVFATGGAAINSNDPAGNALRVAGTVRVDTLGTSASTTLCRNASNQISGCSSSARYKEHITDLALGLAVIQRMRPVAYDWKETHEADIGFVAEEIAEIDPRLVTRNAAGEIEGVKYERLTAVLAVALKDLDARIEAIERQLGVGRGEKP